jgi:hypothetical protein
MALDLTLNIKAEAGDAKRVLADVEQGIKRIEGTSNATAPAVSKVTTALKQNAEGTARVNTVTNQLSTSTKAYENAALKAAQSVGILNAGQVQAVKNSSGLAAAIGMSTVAMTALTAAVLVGVTAVGALVGLLVSATKHYFETSDATRDSRDALKELAVTWEYTQRVIGGAVLGGGFSIVKPIDALNAALLISVAYLKKVIEDYRKLAVLGGAYIAPGATKAIMSAFTQEDKYYLKPETQTDYIAELQREASTMIVLTKERKAQLEAAILLGKGTEELTRKFGLSAIQLKFFTEQQKADTRAKEDAKRAAEKHQEQLEKEAKAWEKLTNKLKDWAATQKANMLLPGFTQAISQDTLDNAALVAWGKAQAEKRQGTYAVGPELMLGGVPWATELSEETIAANMDSITKVIDPWRAAFTQLGQDMPHMVFGALMAGGSIVGSLAAGLGSVFSEHFAGALANANGNPAGVGGGTQALGAVGAGLGIAVGGYALGSKYGKGKGALAGAASGAMAGAAFGSVVPGIGTAVGAGVGAIVGAFSGWLGGNSKEKKALEEMNQIRDEWIQSFGGLQKTKDMADKLGVSLGNAFTTKKPEEFYKVVERVNAAIEKQKNLYEGIDKITSGVNARASVFSQTATAQSQAEFDRIGTMGFAAFGANMKTHGNPLEALAAMKPTLDAITAAQKEYNFTASESVQRLLDINAVVTNNSGAFQALAADSQILQGAIQANWKDMDLFKAVSTDVAIQIGNITANGVPMAQALALNQPVLQSLWEAQQKFHFETDEATQALLDQAKEQGLVGANMKNVNEKILDVLVSIAEVLGATIPDAMRTMEDAARDTAAGMNEAFDSVRGPNVGDGSGGSPDSYHAGGPIRFAHSGGLGPDEFPVIAQSGEFMMRRSAVSKYGVGFMQSVNNGTAGGGVSIVINNPQVRDDRDLNELTDKIMQRLPKRLTRAGL